MRKILVPVLVCCSSLAFAQGKPDYKNIEQLTHDAASKFNYEKLFRRYMADDTTLSTDCMYYLYYGFFFQSGYDEYVPGDYLDSLKDLSKLLHPSDADRKDVVRLGKKALALKPFDLKTLNLLCTIYNNWGDKDNYNINRFKFRMIGSVILASGDGRSPQTAFHILSVPDEYTIMSALGLEVAGYKTDKDSKVDYLEAKPNNQGVAGLYFDVKQIFEGYYRVPKRTDDGTKK